jgi:tRNA(adenine34) deaminase
MHEQHEKFMGIALASARLAQRAGEVPIGAVLVQDGKVIARGYNLTRTKSDPTGHAEMVIIRKAISKLQNERFLNTDLYVTLEPCAMCAGAIVQARIPRVIFGAYDAKAGACGSVLAVLPNTKLNHRPAVTGGVRADECVALLKKFFAERRREIKDGKLKNGKW